MADDFHFYEPALGHGLKHSPFKAIIAPRPIGWISSLDKNGRANLAPYSFFNAVAEHPPVLAFASNDWKDSVRNISETGEFCWNLVSRPLAEAMNVSSAGVAPEVDEFELAGLHKGQSRKIRAPYVAESPVAMECKVTEIIQLKDAAGEKIQSWVTFGEVVGVHINKSHISDGVYETSIARPVMRAGGVTDYFETVPEAKFAMKRPR